MDSILDGERNAWIPALHINVNSNLSMFAPGIRNSRTVAEASLNELAEGWAKGKPSFDEVLNHELASYGPAIRQALAAQLTRNQAAMASDDISSILDMSVSLVNRYSQLARLFERNGIAEEIAFAEVMRFLDWPGNKLQPTHRIFAYLFAALGWRISSGQRPKMKASILNDFTAIATYAPYVDAMFVDKECASLLQQGRLKSELSYKAQIFSLSNTQRFLDYLDDLCDAAPQDVVMLAGELYGAT